MSFRHKYWMETLKLREEVREEKRKIKILEEVIKDLKSEKLDPKNLENLLKIGKITPERYKEVKEITELAKKEMKEDVERARKRRRD